MFCSMEVLEVRHPTSRVGILTDQQRHDLVLGLKGPEPQSAHLMTARNQLAKEADRVPLEPVEVSGQLSNQSTRDEVNTLWSLTRALT